MQASSKLLLALALATATALRHAACNRNTALQLRGGSDDDNGEGLFGGEAVSDDAGGEGLLGGESKLALRWMNVKLQNLQKKRPDDYKSGKAFDASHAYARGVAFLATECGAYVRARAKIKSDFCNCVCSMA